MKKILILLVLVVVMTGCSADVNLSLTDDSISEIISIYDNDYSHYRSYVPVYDADIISDVEPDISKPGIKYYNRNLVNNTLIYSYDYKFDDYFKSRSLNSAFSSFGSYREDNKLFLYTEKRRIGLFDTYYKLDNIRINIKSSRKVLESNADSVNGDIYTWNFNKDTENNIYLVLDDPKPESPKPKPKPSVKPNPKPDKKPAKKEEKGFMSFVKKHLDYIIFLAIIAVCSFFIIIAIKLSKND